MVPGLSLAKAQKNTIQWNFVMIDIVNHEIVLKVIILWGDNDEICNLIE